MNGFKERVIHEIIKLGKKSRKLRMPAIVMVAVFLAVYHAVRDFFWQFRYHPVRQRLLAGILILALLAGQIELVNVFADTGIGFFGDSESTQISAFTELPEEVREQTASVGTGMEKLTLPDTLEAVVVMPESENPSEGETQPKDAGEETKTHDTQLEKTVTIEDVTWTSETEYDSDKEGNYLFTAVLPEDYVLAKGVSLPTITVTLQKPAEDTQATDGGTIALLMRALDEENSSDMVYYPEGSFDSYSWEIWTGEEWQEIGEYEPELVVDKEEWCTYRFRCVVKRDGVTYTAQAKDDWQTENMGVMLMAENTADSEKSEYMYYNNKSDSSGSGSRFNIKGIDNGTEIQTTYANGGYRTASAVAGGSKVSWNSAGEVPMGNSLYGSREISLVYNDRYAKIKYTVENKGSESQSFQVGSSADVMIGNNDCAPVVGSSSGLVMDGSPKNDYKFNLVAPSANTLWYGYYSQAYTNIFTNLEDRNTAYNKDSGMAWSWSDTVAPGQTWSRYVLLGVGELPNPPKNPTLTNTTSKLEPGVSTTFTGKADPGNTVNIEVYGEEFTGTADGNGNFSVTVTPPQHLPEGTTDVKYYAVSADGGISDVKTITVPVTKKPEITLTDAETTVAEDDSTLNDAWYRSFIRSSSGTVIYNASSVKIGTPGIYTVPYKASKSGYPDATAALKIKVLPLPLELSDVTAKRVSGKDSFTLSASLKHIGKETISETGFVWGAMQNPTVSLNNGSQKTPSVIKTKNGSLSITAEDIVDGVTYYVRAYAISGGNVYYSPQNSFSIDGKNYGTFTIKNNSNNTFTVTRSGGSDGAQKVYYRTVNGSAVGGTHFTHNSGYVTFADGDSASKEVKVTESAVTNTYGGKSATAYSNADRTYQVEIYRVDGGGTLGSTTRAERTMTKNSSYIVDRNCYVTKKDPLNNGNKASKNENVDENSPTYAEVFTMNRYYTSYVPYLKETAHKYEMHLNVNVYEYEDGWEYLRFTSGSQQAVAKFEINPTGNCREWKNGWIPRERGFTENGVIRAYDFSGMEPYASTIHNQYVFGFDINTQPIKVEVAATGNGPNDWELGGCEQESVYSDIKEPQLIGIAPMDGSTYRVGDKVTISLVFDEIVDATNSNNLAVNESFITTSWGKFTYAGGAGTNVLYFTGTVPTNAGSSISVTSLNCAGQIKDMCNNSGGTASGGSGSTTVSVNTKVPTVSFTNKSVSNQTAKATISATNADKLQYTWSRSSTLPVKGWISATNTSSQTVGNRLTTGTWYLHVLGTYTTTGKTTHKYTSFNITSTTTGGGGEVELPELTLSANNSNWARQRTINVTKKPSGGTVKVTTPSGTTSTVTGSSYTAKENGSYQFTLKAGDETVVKTVTVSKIDQMVPSATIDGPSNLTQNENVKLTIKPVDTGGSGVNTVTGTWTKTVNGGSTSTESAKLEKNSDGTYSVTTPGSAENKYTYGLKVTVTDNAGNTKSASSKTYTVNLKKPAVEVRRTNYNLQKGDTYSYTVIANENTITAVQLPDGTITTELSGTFKLTSRGTYYVTVSDEAGHVVRSQPMEVGDVDGVAPEVRLNQQDENWTDGAVQLDVSIYEEGSIKSAVWEQVGVSSNKPLTTKFSGEDSIYSGSFSVKQNGTYRVTVTDNAGNTGTDSITVTNIDKTKPTVNCTINATANATSGWYTDASVPVKLNFDDIAGKEEGGTPSGVDKVQYKLVSTNTPKPTDGLTSLNESQVGNKTYTHTITGNGTYYLYYKVTDKKGNVTDGFSSLIQKDSYAGAATITGPTEGQLVSNGLTLHINLTYGPGGGSLYGGTTKLAGMAGYSGMNVANKSTTAGYKVTDAGRYYFRYHKNASNADKDWKFDVYRITFDSRGGSAVGSQLVWHDGKSGVRCNVKKPKDPTRTGYTFGGWYINEACTEKFDFESQARANLTLYAKWTANPYTVTFNYQGATGGKTETTRTVTYDSSYGTLPNPKRTGYNFKGWYTAASGGTKVTSTTTVKTTVDHILYARWVDDIPPAVPALQSNITLSTDWTNAQKTIPLALYDGVGVTELWVSIDGGKYEQVSGFTSGAGSKKYSYVVKEGNHTYQFKAKDSAGNISGVSEKFTIKLDTAKPVIGEVTYENKVTNILHWIIGKKSMIIHVPVTDTDSNRDVGGGITQISYILTPTDGSAATTGTAGVNDGKAKITVSADFKGTVAINGRDAAGNAADGKTIGASDGGIIVEDNAPAIRVYADRSSTDTEGKQGNKVTLSDDYYMSAPALTVTVKDDDDNAVTAGIASASYRIGETESPVSADTSASWEQVSFTIPADKLSVGINTIIVETADNAGNTATGTITVKVKKPVGKPEAVIDYPTEMLTGLLPHADYTVNGTKYQADTEGCIPIKEEWIGRPLSIVHKGNGNDTKDSEAQEFTIPARPKSPSAMPELASRTDNSVTLKEIEGAQYRINDGDWQTSTEFTGLEEKTEYVFSVYYPATDTTFASLSVGGIEIMTMPKPPADDTFLIDFVGETFALEGGVEAFTDENGTEKIDAGNLTDYVGQTLYIRYPADGEIPAGMIKEVQIPARPEKPKVETVNASYPGAKDGKVTGLTEDIAYEIRVKTDDTWGEWTDAVLNQTEIKNLPAGEYEVRVKAAEGENFTGEAKAVTVEETPAVVVDTPKIEIDYSRETLKGFTPGEKYVITVNGQQETITMKPDESLKLKEEWLGETISIVHQGNGKDKADSEALEFTIPQRPVAPSAIPEIAERTDSTVTLKAVEGAQYRIQGGEWQDSPVFTGLSEKTEYVFEITYPEKDGAFISKVSEAVIITLPSVPKETAVEIDYQKESLTLPDGVEAFADEECSKPITSGSLADYVGQTIYIRYAADGEIPAGMIKEVQIPQRPAKPKVTGVDVASPDGTGKLTGLIAGESYEISTDGGKTWESKKADKNGEITGLVPGSYVVRVKAETSDFAGEWSKPVIIGVYRVEETPTQPSDNTTSAGEQNTQKPDDAKKEQSPEEKNVQTISASIENGKITASEKTVTTGNASDTSKTVTQLVVGDGAVTVTVVCKEKTCTASVRDTVAVANAVLSPKQIQQVNDGENIEIRVDVKDISKKVPKQDKKVIKDGFTECKKEKSDLKLGNYVDISMFIKVGEGDWNAITNTKEPIDVVIGIPKKLKKDGRKFSIIRSHEGEYTLLPDIDDNPNTITISTGMFSAYAIAYEQGDKAEESVKCGLCYICPTFLGICYFIWLLIVLAIMILFIGISICKKRKKEQVRK